MKAYFKNHWPLITLIILSLIKGIFWIGMVPPLHMPDVDRHLSTVMWYAEPKKHDWATKNELLNEDMFDSTTYHIPEEYSNYLTITQFEQGRLNPNNHQVFNDKQLVGPGEKELLNSKLNTHFTVLPPTMVNYPPLYYQGAALFYRLFYGATLPTRITVVQLYSLVISLISLFFIYKTALLLNFSKKSSTLFAGAISFQPMFSLMSIAINPDILLILALTTFFYFATAILKSNWGWKNLIGLSAAALLAILAKPIGYLSLVFIPLLFIFKSHHSKKLIGWSIIGIASILSLVSVFIFPTIASVINKLVPGIIPAQSAFPNLLTALSHYSTAHFSPFEQYEIYASFWGWFGWFDYPLPKYAILALLTATTIGLLLFLAWLIVSKKDEPDIKKTYFFLSLSSLLFFLAVIASEFSYFYSSGSLYGVQGRYFLPIILPIFLILLRGWEFIARKLSPETLLLIFFIAMAFVNMTALFLTIIPAYYL